jgi:hypothetical protein
MCVAITTTFLIGAARGIGAIQSWVTDVRDTAQPANAVAPITSATATVALAMAFDRMGNSVVRG